jgi:hypothetical protein
VATFPPLISPATGFAGEAVSNVVMLDLRRAFPLAGGRASLLADLGAGLARNELNNVLESVRELGALPFAKLADGAEAQFAARGALGLSIPVSSRVAFNAGASVFRLGSFKTGSSRSPTTVPNPVPTGPITPYELRVWDAGLSAGVVVAF